MNPQLWGNAVYFSRALIYPLIVFAKDILMPVIVRGLLGFTLFLFAFRGIATAQTAAKVAGATAATSAAATANLLDINTATPAQLKGLKGVGDAYAKRIVDGRPYTAKNQLTGRGILPQATYDGIKDQIIARKLKN